MSYLDRMKKARYRSPSGKSFDFLFDEIARTGEKKVSIQEFPEQNLPDVRDLGDAQVKLPMTVYFTGEDYDKTADKFWKALAEQGVGLLKHPRFGDINVLPVTRSQNENFISDMGRAVFTVEFVRVSDRIGFFAALIGSLVEAVTGVINAVANLVEDFAGAITGLMTAVSVGGISAIRDSITGATGIAQNSFGSIVAGSAQLSADFKAGIFDLNTNAATLANDPGLLLQKMNTLMGIPAKAEVGILSKIQSYKSCFDLLKTNLPDETAVVSGIPIARTKEECYNGLMIRNAVTNGLVTSVQIGTFANREDAVNSVDLLLSVKDDFFADIDRFSDFFPDFYVPLELLRSFNQTIYSGIFALYSTALTSNIENIKILEKTYTPIDLVYELYGGIDRVEEFTLQNSLKDTEYFLLKPGREIRYFENVT